MLAMPVNTANHSKDLSRRRFLTKSAFWAGVLLTMPGWLQHLIRSADAAVPHAATAQLLQNAPIARYWVSTRTADIDCLRCHQPDEDLTENPHAQGDVIIKCELCAQECMIPDGERGRCRARIHVDGQLRSLVYGHPVSVHVDPIEKKPFYHYRPGAQAFSLATTGCPLSCKFCQNWQISQARPEDFSTDFYAPEVVVHSTRKRNVPIIAFTYNEPTVFTEYLTDIARMARTQDLESVLISCGFMNPDPLAEMCDVLDGIKIDLKGFSRRFYQEVCGAELEPVLRSIKAVAERGTHMELVNLVVPTLNDSDRMIRDLVHWVLNEVGPDVPLHFTRFHPDYQMRNLPPTPVATLERAYAIARDAGLHYPYVGNVPGHSGNHTYCPSCGKVVIRRTAFFVTAFNIEDGRCKFCETSIAGVFHQPGEHRT